MKILAMHNKNCNRNGIRIALLLMENLGTKWFVVDWIKPFGTIHQSTLKHSRSIN
jgi:hypothetical protein